MHIPRTIQIPRPRSPIQLHANKAFLGSSIIKLSSFLAASPALVAATSFPVIRTNYGPVKGEASPDRDGVTVYKGIPFAAPPTGSKRWTAPTAPEPWTDVFNATHEDCLYLNIWTPTYNSTDAVEIQSMIFPVYVWIFGRSFEGGSGDVKTYDGTGLASKDIIVVTINYRLGAFGFLAHPDLSRESGYNTSGNYDILDQQFALRWVQDNIAYFGGNPSRSPWAASPPAPPVPLT
ncbi:Alpha/Beta hydrolase protein [Aspergillus falconensis]